jgi:hypothetical protein
VFPAWEIEQPPESLEEFAPGPSEPVLPVRPVPLLLVVVLLPPEPEPEPEPGSPSSAL